MNNYTRDKLWQELYNIAPLYLAGAWDNVGVLLDPIPPQHVRNIQTEKILVTIDLTESVFAEALAGEYTVIITYHPIIFSGLKALTQHNSQTRTLLHAAQKGISIYSPHTALDAVKGGVCDWLASTLFTPSEESYSIDFFLANQSTYLTEFRPIEPNPQSEKEGAGRICTLQKPLQLYEICKRLEFHLNQNRSPLQDKIYLRVVTPFSQNNQNYTVHSLALCPGAGGSLFNSLNPLDLLITGEMSHHDLLKVAERGGAVVLTEHSRCERGFLHYYKGIIEEKLGITVDCAQSDDDPLSLFVQ